MSQPQLHRVQELLNLELDGALTAADESELGELLAAEPALTVERQQLASLDDALAATRITVRPGFREEVLAGLPAAGWEVQRHGGWRLAAGLVVLFALIAMALVGLSGSLASGPVGGLVATLLDFGQSSLLVGAGLAAASWRGLGMAVGSAFAESSASVLLFGGLVLVVNVLFVLLLVRRPTAAGVRADGSTSD